MSTEITWLGHNAWSIRAGEHRLLLDPFLNDNPLSPKKADQVEADFIYTMGPADALEAVRLLRPRRVVPIHNGTWPIIAQDAEGWARQVRAETGVEAVVLPPGGKIVLQKLCRQSCRGLPAHGKSSGGLVLSGICNDSL